jgi:hypothetical protein
MKETVKMKVEKLRLPPAKVKFVWDEEVVDCMIVAARKNGWVFNADDLNSSLYSDPKWTSGDAAMTFIEAKIFIVAVFEALNDVVIDKGNDFVVDFTFEYVAVEG